MASGDSGAGANANSSALVSVRTPTRLINTITFRRWLAPAEVSDALEVRRALLTAGPPVRSLFRAYEGRMSDKIARIPSAISSAGDGAGLRKFHFRLPVGFKSCPAPHDHAPPYQSLRRKKRG